MDSTLLRRPPTIAWASWLMIAGGVLTAASAVSGLLQAGTLVQRTQERLLAFGESAQSLRANTWWLGPATLTFTLVVLTFLWVWMAWKNRRGRAWARTLASALAVLEVVQRVDLSISQVMDNVFPSPDRHVESVAVLAITVAVFVLLWLPSSSAFYAATRRQSLING